MLLLVQSQAWRNKHPDNIKTECRGFCGWKITKLGQKGKICWFLISFTELTLMSSVKVETFISTVSNVNIFICRVFFLRFKICQTGSVKYWRLDKVSTIHGRFYLLNHSQSREQYSHSVGHILLTDTSVHCRKLRCDGTGKETFGFMFSVLITQLWATWSYKYYLLQILCVVYYYYVLSINVTVYN